MVPQRAASAASSAPGFDAAAAAGCRAAKLSGPSGRASRGAARTCVQLFRNCCLRPLGTTHLSSTRLSSAQLSSTPLTSRQLSSAQPSPAKPNSTKATSNRPHSYLTVTTQLPHSYLTVTTQLPHEKPWTASRIVISRRNKLINYMFLFFQHAILLPVQGFSCGSCVVTVR